MQCHFLQLHTLELSFHLHPICIKGGFSVTAATKGVVLVLLLAVAVVARRGAERGRLFNDDDDDDDDELEGAGLFLDWMFVTGTTIAADTFIDNDTFVPLAARRRKEVVVGTLEDTTGRMGTTSVSEDGDVTNTVSFAVSMLVVALLVLLLLSNSVKSITPCSLARFFRTSVKDTCSTSSTPAKEDEDEDDDDEVDASPKYVRRHSSSALKEKVTSIQ